MSRYIICFHGAISVALRPSARRGSPFDYVQGKLGSMFTDKLFTGQRELAELGIYHYNARFYSPTLGRFLSSDTIVPGAADPQAFNRYSYVLNNPARYTDPSGHLCVEGTSRCVSNLTGLRSGSLTSYYDAPAPPPRVGSGA